MNNVGTLDVYTIASHASLVSGKALKSTRGDFESFENKTEKGRRFRDILREKFSISVPLSIDNVKDIQLSEEEYLAKLQDAVHEAGDALSDTVSTENILAYKQAIKSFVQYIVSRAYEVENVVTGGLNPARKKAWTIVKVINTKLDSLICDLMYNQLKKIEMLKRIDEIKGLLVDLQG